MTREELYDLVWEQPTIHVAGRFGLSYAALRKLCAHYNIPLPPPGHWTKLAHGKPVQRTPLPKAPAGFFGRFNAVLQQFGETSARFADAQIASFDLGAGSLPGADLSAEDAARIDRYQDLLEAALQNGRADADGFVRSQARHLPAVEIGAAMAPRAVALFGALLRFAAGQGARVVETDRGLCLTMDDELFAIRIHEARQRRPYGFDSDDEDRVRAKSAGSKAGGPDRKLKKSWPKKNWPTWRFDPSGILCLELRDPRPFQWAPRNVAGAWQDNRKRMLEECLPEIGAALIRATQTIKRGRLAAESEAGKQAARKKQIQADAVRAEEEQKHELFLDKTIGSHALYRQSLAFAEYLAGLRPEDDPELERLYRAVLERVDALEQSLDRDALKAEIALHGLFKP